MHKKTIYLKLVNSLNRFIMVVKWQCEQLLSNSFHEKLHDQRVRLRVVYLSKVLKGLEFVVNSCLFHKVMANSKLNFSRTKMIKTQMSK